MKIYKLEAKFDLKILLTRETSNLANKLDSFSLVLQESRKTLEQRDFRNSKF